MEDLDAVAAQLAKLGAPSVHGSVGNLSKDDVEDSESERVPVRQPQKMRRVVISSDEDDEEISPDERTAGGIRRRISSSESSSDESGASDTEHTEDDDDHVDEIMIRQNHANAEVESL